MFGAAIGDALGSAFEFMRADEIEAAIGEPFAWHYLSPLPGSLLPPREPGLPTDDTAMALSAAHVIVSSQDPSAVDFAQAFLADLDPRGGRFGRLFWEGAPGGTTMRALKRLKGGADPATCGQPDDGANGAAMRVHPVGFLRDRNDVLRVAGLQAAVTHGHPGAIAAAQAVAASVHDALAGFELEFAPPAGVEEPRFLDAWHRAHDGAIRSADRLPRHLLGADMSGWVTVATAHAIAYIYQDDPCRAIAAAAASGGDTDTVASIVGAIVGARSGLESLDSDWIAGLKIRAQIETAVELLADAIP